MPLGLSVNALAMALGVPATRIHEIVKERRGITADTAERLARYFGGDAASWLALQADYDLKALATRRDIALKVTPREGAAVQLAGTASRMVFALHVSGSPRAHTIGDLPESGLSPNR